MTYCIARDETDPFRGEYATREEAILKGPSEWLSLKPGDRFYTGAARPLGLHCVDAEAVLEAARDALRDEAGEAADEALACTPEQEKDLEESLTNAMLAWMERHKVTVSCWAVDDVQHHTFTAEAA